MRRRAVRLQHHEVAQARATASAGRSTNRRAPSDKAALPGILSFSKSERQPSGLHVFTRIQIPTTVEDRRCFAGRRRPIWCRAQQYSLSMCIKLQTSIRIAAPTICCTSDPIHARNQRPRSAVGISRRTNGAPIFEVFFRIAVFLATRFPRRALHQFIGRPIDSEVAGQRGRQHRTARA